MVGCDCRLGWKVTELGYVVMGGVWWIRLKVGRNNPKARRLSESMTSPAEPAVLLPVRKGMHCKADFEGKL